ncbi:MAG: HNH endonuclease [Rhodospirillales bacterium]|nr:HNH endonuclease [Rhodospirillales bacterium]
MAVKPIDPVANVRASRREQSTEAMRHRDRCQPYNRRAWNVMRSVKLAVDPLCECCGDVPASEVHHRNANPWDNAWSNLASLCKRCHSRTTCVERRPQPLARCWATYP